MTNSKINIAVAGAGGRMGCRIIALAAEDPVFSVVGAIEAVGHPAVGRDAGLIAGCGELKINITSDCDKALSKAGVLIDFTSPSAAAMHIHKAVEHKIGIIIGTTGLDSSIEKELIEASKIIPVISAPNMSVGVNLLFRIAPIIAKALGDSYDIEIVEAHHNKKKDAPSGTALKLYDVIANIDSEIKPVFGREGKEAKRKPKEIGIHAVRAGDIVGEHTVYFAASGERIELTHKASSRDTFAIGALRAAKFLYRKPAGRYTMADVLFPST